jgi:ferrochelatase
MGGARDQNELREFLKNMFLDRRIINSPARFFVSFFMSRFRTPKVWKNYELIGGSKILEHTQNLTNRLNTLSNGAYDTLFAMRYTKPNVTQILENRHYDEILLFPMYPHFSSTTTLSSFDDANAFLKGKNIKVKRIERFFEDELFNQTIIDSIKKHYCEGAHLIFSAHSLPLSIAKNDPYPEEIKKHTEILSQMLTGEGLKFKGIHLAYQSKLGPIKWLEPSLGETLSRISPEPVIIYPISFTIDNSETDFELDIFYRDIAKEFGITSYSVCKAQNDNDKFAEFLSGKIKGSF